MIRRTCSSALLLAGVLLAAQPPLAAQAPPAPAAQPPAADAAKRVEADAIDALIAKGDVVVLDVREPSELKETGTVKGAIHIPLGQLESRLGELPKDKVILTACRSGGRASWAMALLEAKGFKTAGFCGLQNYKGQRVFPGEAKS
jgi:rhodanese-related sulfurtransferase